MNQVYNLGIANTKEAFVELFKKAQNQSNQTKQFIVDIKGYKLILDSPKSLETHRNWIEIADYWEEKEFEHYIKSRDQSEKIEQAEEQKLMMLQEIESKLSTIENKIKTNDPSLKKADAHGELFIKKELRNLERKYRDNIDPNYRLSKRRIIPKSASSFLRFEDLVDNCSYFRIKAAFLKKEVINPSLETYQKNRQKVEVQLIQAWEEDQNKSENLSKEEKDQKQNILAPKKQNKLSFIKKIRNYIKKRWTKFKKIFFPKKSLNSKSNSNNLKKESIETSDKFISKVQAEMNSKMLSKEDNNQLIETKILSPTSYQNSTQTKKNTVEEILQEIKANEIRIEEERIKEEQRTNEIEEVNKKVRSNLEPIVTVFEDGQKETNLLSTHSKKINDTNNTNSAIAKNNNQKSKKGFIRRITSPIRNPKKFFSKAS